MQISRHNLRGLTSRTQFLKAARGRRLNRLGLGLQMTSVSDPLPGVGFTVTKKSGNSPQRNRIKRRLRAAARTCASHFASQHDYVLIGRSELLSMPYAELVGTLSHMLDKINTKAQPAQRT